MSREKAIKSKDEGHRGRLRERFLQSGLEGFLDYEIVELLLTLGTPRRDCKQAAKETLRKYKTLGHVLEVSPEELQSIKGIGKSNYFGLKLCQEVARRLAKEKILKKVPLGSSQAVADYLQKSIGGKQKEYFVALYLNSKNELIKDEVLSIGTVDSNLIHARELFKGAIKLSASQIIVAHNHPSQDGTPSPHDVALTRRLQEASKIFDINLVDHLIITANSYLSLKEENLI